MIHCILTLLSKITKCIKSSFLVNIIKHPGQYNALLKVASSPKLTLFPFVCQIVVSRHCVSFLSKAALSSRSKTMRLIFLKASHVYNVLSQADIPIVACAAWHGALKPLSVEWPLSLHHHLPARHISGHRNTEHHLKLQDKREHLLFEQVLETCCNLLMSRCVGV